MMEVQVLTAEMQARIIKFYVQEKLDIENYGAARMIYTLEDELRDYLVEKGIELDSSTCYIVKIAMGVGGVNQIAAEVKTYRNFGDEGYLAAIPAAGRFVEIMERVNPVDISFRDFLDIDEANLFCEVNGIEDDVLGLLKKLEGDDDFIDLSNYDIKYLENLYYKSDVEEKIILDYDSMTFNTIMSVINSLVYIFGATGDCGQVGFNWKGDVVAYDYGFYSDSEKTQTSRDSDMLAGNDDYLSTLAAALERTSNDRSVNIAKIEDIICDDDKDDEYDEYGDDEDEDEEASSNADEGEVNDNEFDIEWDDPANSYSERMALASN